MTGVTVLNGLLGGLLATIVMTALMMPLGDDSPPPTALFLSKYVGEGDPEEFMLQGMLLHFLYGTGGGIVLVGVLIAGGFERIELVEGVGAGLG